MAVFGINIEEKPWYYALGMGVFVGSAARPEPCTGSWFKPHATKRSRPRRSSSRGSTRRSPRAAPPSASSSQFREEVKRLELELSKLLQILPSKRNTEELIKRIETLTRQGDFTLKKFTPGEFIQKDFYAEWPIDIQVEGTYHNLALFFDRMSRFSRIVNVEDMKITSLDNVAGQVDRGDFRRQDLHLHGRRGRRRGHGRSGCRRAPPGATPPSGRPAPPRKTPEGAGRRRRGRMRRAALLAALLALVVGGLALRAGARAGARRPVATPPAVIAPVPESPGQSLIEQDESAHVGPRLLLRPGGPAGPVPLAPRARAEPRRRRSGRPGSPGISIDDLVVHGIWKTKAGYVAQIRATDNKSYLDPRRRPALRRRGHPRRSQRGHVPAEPQRSAEREAVSGSDQAAQRDGQAVRTDLR